MGAGEHIADAAAQRDELQPHAAEQIEFQLQDFKFMGISNILALRGDCLTGEKRFSPVPGGYVGSSVYPAIFSKSPCNRSAYVLSRVRRERRTA